MIGLSALSRQFTGRARPAIDDVHEYWSERCDLQSNGRMIVHPVSAALHCVHCWKEVFAPGGVPSCPQCGWTE